MPPHRSSQDDDDNDNEPRGFDEAPAEEEEDDGRLMGDSGLTDDQRRKIRKSQRELLQELEEAGQDLDLADARSRNNKIYERVRFTREAVLDGENIISIAKKASQQVDRLIQVPRYDAVRLVTKLRERISLACEKKTGQRLREGEFDWEILGSAAGACFNAVPTGVCFLNGPLTNGQPPVQRARAAPRRRVVQEDKDAVEERPEDVKGHTEKDENKLSAIEQSMKDMSRALHKRVDATYRENKKRLRETYEDEVPASLTKKLKKYGVEIDAVQFLFNPESFTQTVENIFHYSFLVKNGAAAINVREKGLELGGVASKPGLAIKYVKGDGANQPPSKQGILALTMKDWRDLCRAYNVEKGDLPTRKINKKVYQASLSQATN